MPEDPRLQSRLRSCLQTILDLEQSLGQMDATRPILAEFVMLRDICGRIETLMIHEDDVRRIEDATANFLHELQLSLKNNLPALSGGRVLQ
jgi:hypothetical protein